MQFISFLDYAISVSITHSKSIHFSAFCETLKNIVVSEGKWYNWNFIKDIQLYSVHKEDIRSNEMRVLQRWLIG